MEEAINTENLKQLNLKRYQIIAMNHSGKSAYSIAKDLSLDKKYVKKIVDRFNQHGQVEYDGRCTNQGRTQLITDQNEINFIQTTENNQYDSFKSLKGKTREGMDVKCSDSTIRRKLNTLGRFLLPRWIPKLFQSQIEKRKLFYKEFIWGYLKSKVEDIAPQTKSERISAIKEAWEKLDTSIIKKCISHLKEHIKVIKTVNGYFQNTLNDQYDTG